MENSLEWKAIRPDPIVVKAEDSLACRYLMEIDSLLEYEERFWARFRWTAALDTISDARLLLSNLCSHFRDNPGIRYHNMAPCIRDCDITCIPRSIVTLEDASQGEKKSAVTKRNVLTNYMISYLKTADQCMRDALEDDAAGDDLPPFKTKWEELKGYDTALEIVDPVEPEVEEESSDK